MTRVTSKELRLSTNRLSDIVRELNDLGFRYVTYGWDSVIRSAYYKWDDEPWTPDRGRLVFPEILEGDDLPDFYYAREVEEADVEALAEANMLDELLATLAV